MPMTAGRGMGLGGMEPALHCEIERCGWGVVGDAVGWGSIPMAGVKHSGGWVGWWQISQGVVLGSGNMLYCVFCCPFFECRTWYVSYGVGGAWGWGGEGCQPRTPDNGQHCGGFTFAISGNSKCK